MYNYYTHMYVFYCDLCVQDDMCTGTGYTTLVTIYNAVFSSSSNARRSDANAMRINTSFKLGAFNPHS